MLDESLLDAPDALARADARGLLRGAAGAGARVRTGLRQAAESGLTELRPDGRPRAVLVAGPGPVAACVADLLGALGNGAAPVTALRPTGPLAAPGALSWSLPGWAGPLDLLLLVTPDGAEAGLSLLVEQAYRRGCTVVAVAPPATPLGAAVGETRGLSVPLAPGPYDAYETVEEPLPAPLAHPEKPAEGFGPGLAGLSGPPSEHELDIPAAPAPRAPLPMAPSTLWGLLTPLLVLTDRLGLVAADHAALSEVADRLDRVAERCGPAVETFGNTAKTLAAELAGALPLLWSEGAVAGAVARHASTALTALAGRPALAAELPEAMTAHGALLKGTFSAGADPDDFFRDRVEDPEALHVRVVLLREQGLTGDSALVAARDLAYAHDAPLSELEATEGSGPLETAAELIATTDFAAVYLALAGGESSWA
ncbi:SIS domain-containing protein [Streptomyces sp. NPDC054796]